MRRRRADAQARGAALRGREVLRKPRTLFLKNALGEHPCDGAAAEPQFHVGRRGLHDGHVGHRLQNLVGKQAAQNGLEPLLREALRVLPQQVAANERRAQHAGHLGHEELVGLQAVHDAHGEGQNLVNQTLRGQFEAYYALLSPRGLLQRNAELAHLLQATEARGAPTGDLEVLDDVAAAHDPRFLRGSIALCVGRGGGGGFHVLQQHAAGLHQLLQRLVHEARHARGVLVDVLNQLSRHSLRVLQVERVSDEVGQL
ncbi:alpha/beta hydrolase [Babesia caballi]|uniref:Alpha/beta hydrolase n=1 Tax=Babesia caballi TaxID=5871 RepID=A0AAV4LZL5_BABCB|nr:alpha/beta hydrolase [Babesia caballi]